MSAQVP